MRMFRSIDVSGSALTAHRLWMDAISSNLANVNTTRAPRGGLTGGGCLCSPRCWTRR